jgi:hypothetical protein
MLSLEPVFSLRWLRQLTRGTLTPMLRYCYAIVALFFHCSFTDITLLLHCLLNLCSLFDGFVNSLKVHVALLFHCCYTAVTLLLHGRHTADTLATLLLHCCCNVY